MDRLPKIIPVNELKNTANILKMCNETDGPIVITKNGYGEAVIMSLEAYEEIMEKKSWKKKKCQFNLLILLCFFKLIHSFIFNFWLRWVFDATQGLSLVAESRGYSSVRCVGFSSWWLLLLQSAGCRVRGLQLLRHVGSGAPVQ